MQSQTGIPVAGSLAAANHIKDKEGFVSNELRVGLAGEAHSTVDDTRSAQAMGSGDVPVFATPAMIALMEEAATNALRPALAAGQTSVGVRVDVRHLSATPIGALVRAQARVTQVEGRRISFRVTADDGSETIGEGLHERMIVDRERFIQRTQSKR